MDSTRQSKISRLIQKELGDMFQKQTQATKGVLVSVSAVRVSPDLSVAKAYVSIFPSERAEEILNNINANSNHTKISFLKCKKIGSTRLIIDSCSLVTREIIPTCLIECTKMRGG